VGYSSSPVTFYVTNTGGTITVSILPPSPSVRPFSPGAPASPARTDTGNSSAGAGQSSARIPAVNPPAASALSSTPPAAGNRIDFSSARLTYTASEASLSTVSSTRAARTAAEQGPAPSSLPANTGGSRSGKNTLPRLDPPAEQGDGSSPEAPVIPEQIDGERRGVETEEGTSMQAEDPPASAAPAVYGSGFTPGFTGPGGAAATGAVSGGEAPVRNGQPGGPDNSQPEHGRSLTPCIMPLENRAGPKRKGQARIRPRYGDAGI
jgi:hypothetical protein